MIAKQAGVYKLALTLINSLTRFIANRRAEWQGEETESINAGYAASFVPVAPTNSTLLPAQYAEYFDTPATWPAIKVYKLPEAYVSWHAVVFKNFRIFIPALASPHWKEFYNDSYLLKQWLGNQPAAQPLLSPLALVHDQWTRINYYHWIVDALPRLLVLREHYPSSTLIMPQPVPTYVEQTARLLGFTKFLLLGEGEVVQATPLILPMHVAPLGYHNPELLRQLRQEITATLAPNTIRNPPKRRIFASRSRQRLRRLTNEEELIAVLQQYHFECIYFEDLTFAQQVGIMQETEIFIGVHGANLVNLLFMQPGTKVIELFNEDKFSKLGNINFENLIYYRMSVILGLLYSAVPCQTTPGQKPSNDADLMASITVIAQTLAQVLTL